MWEILRSKYTTDGFFDWNQLGEDVTPLFSNVGTIDFMSLFPPSLTPRSGALFEPIPKEKPIPKEATGPKKVQRRRIAEATQQAVAPTVVQKEETNEVGSVMSK